VHSARSKSGELTPEQLAAGARDVGLDFIAITEHNTSDTHGAWGPLVDDDLLVILGQEVTTRTGHWLALGIDPGQVVDWQYGVGDDVIDHHLNQVHRAGGLCVAAHPYAPYPTGVCEYPFHRFDAVEVWNGLWSSDRPWNADNEAALAEWGRGKVRHESLPIAGSGAFEWCTRAEEAPFVRIEVRHPGGHMAALTNPIILT
jgi:hypothetical protein